MKSLCTLEGTRILLTGAGGHLGREMAHAIASGGAELILTGRNAKTLEECRDALPLECRGRCHVMIADIGSPAQVDTLCKAVQARFGFLNGLVNNAYAGRVGPIDVIEAADFRAACDINLTGPFLLVKGLRGALIEGARRSQRSSSIVNIASMYGVVSPDPALYGDSGQNNPVHYGATKAALIQMTRYLACHLGAEGVRCNSIAPGPVPDPSQDSGVADFLSRLAARVPLKRVGAAHEIAGPVVFLLSDAASFVNGAHLAVDGGWTAW